VDEDDEEVIELTRRKIEKAKKEETKFRICDHVRFVIIKSCLKKEHFQSGQSLYIKLFQKRTYIHA